MSTYVRLGTHHTSGRGGRSDPRPAFVSRRVQVRATDHPATDRWITLTTAYSRNGTPMWVVGVVDGFSKPTAPATTYPTLRRARNAANKLYNTMTEETP